MNISVLTPDRKVFEGEISSVKVPGINGEFEVLRNHAALVSSLSAGPVRIKVADGSMKEFTISAGFIEILNNEVSLLVQGVKE